MSFEFSIYDGPLLFAGLLLIGLAGYTWWHRQVPGARPFVALLVSVAIWTFGYALELGASGLDCKLFWARCQYLGISTLPLAWLAFVLRYTGRGGWLRRPAPILLLFPVAINLLVWAAPELVWSAVGLDASGAFPGLVLEHAAGYWAIVIYAYLFLLAGTALLAVALYRAPTLIRAQVRTLLLGALAPWLGNALYSLHLNPLAPLDLTPFGFVVTATAGAWALFGVRLL